MILKKCNHTFCGVIVFLLTDIAFYGGFFVIGPLNSSKKQCVTAMVMFSTAVKMVKTRNRGVKRVDVLTKNL